MQLATRKILDRAFTSTGLFAIGLVALALCVLLVPIVARGARAFLFRGTVEFRRMQLEEYRHGDRKGVLAETEAFVKARNAVLDRAAAFSRELDARADEVSARLSQNRAARRVLSDAIEEQADNATPEQQAQLTQLNDEYKQLQAQRETQRAQDDKLRHHLGDVQRALTDLLGPRRSLAAHLRELLLPEELARRADVDLDAAEVPEDRRPVVLKDRYGQARWDRALIKLHRVAYREEWVPPETTAARDPNAPPLPLVQRFVPRAQDFAGTSLAPLFSELERDLPALLRPRWTFYWRFLFDDARSAHLFGGIWGELLGTLYLTLGAIIFAVPMGIISAIYLIEYAPDNWAIGILRTCISTLAGVPSIVFGLFGLAFFINTLGVSESRSVLAGALTLALLILPTVIRASEEAIRAVPRTYREAALSVGASKWHTVVTVVLPAALPGVLTGIVISMGRAAGETAPIIFTAAVSFGPALKLWDTLNQPTMALPWGVYTLCQENELAPEIRHVQYGMVLTLVLLVLLLNTAAIIMRARVTRRLTG